MNAEQNNQLRKTLVSSPEGKVLMLGVAVSFVYIFWLGIKLLFSPEQSQILVGVTATGLLFGRAAALALGYSLGLGHWTIIPICMVIETVMVLIFYPLFVFSFRHLLVIRWLKATFARTQRAAERQRKKVQRYGIIGLFFFVWLPFWMTGPVVGCVIGFLLGLRIWVNLTVVLLGTYVAIIGWAVFLSQFHEAVAAYSPYAAMVLMVILIIVIIAGYFLHKTLHNHRRPKAANREQ